MTLQEYLDKVNTSAGAFQVQHDIPHPYVYRWLEGTIPNRAWMQKLKEITKGKLTADSFYGE